MRIELGRIRPGFSIRVVLCSAGSSFLLAARIVAAQAVPSYEIGDKATSDIVTPVPIVVANLDETEKLRSISARRVPCLVKFFPAVASMVATNFHEAFVTNRELFLEALQRKYKKPALDAEDLGDPAFWKWVTLQQKQIHHFPLTTNLAEIWAMGAEGEAVEAEMAKPLLDAVSHYMRVEPATLESHVGPPQWQVITTESQLSTEGLDLVYRATNIINRTNLIVFSKAKKNLLAAYPPTQQAYARYAVNFLRENCIVDGEFTRFARWSRTNNLWAADNYRAGDTLVHAGETVDAKVKAALDELRSKLGTQPLALQPAPPVPGRNALWWGTSTLGGLLAATGLVWGLKRRRGPITALVRTDEAGPVTIVDGHSEMAPTRFWRDRALAAERRVAKLTQAIQLRVAPHLGRWLAHKFVQQLVSNRKRLLEVQRLAEAEIQQLEERLENLKLPLNERVLAYEQRISELEKQLSQKEHQNQELLRMTIASARRKLEIEQAKSSAEWN